MVTNSLLESLKESKKRTAILELRIKLLDALISVGGTGRWNTFGDMTVEELTETMYKNGLTWSVIANEQ